MSGEKKYLLKISNSCFASLERRDRFQTFGKRTGTNPTFRLQTLSIHSPIKEYKRVVEAINYGRNSLRNHLSIMVNLAIESYYAKKLIIEKSN